MNRVALGIVIYIALFGKFELAQSPLQYQKAAAEALKSQLQREGRDCLNARDTVEDQNCIVQAEKQTETDLSTFYQNLLSLMDGSDRRPLEQAQQQWLAYRKTSCDAIGQLFQGGSARPGFISRCEIRLARSRMKDLDDIYHLPLHN